MNDMFGIDFLFRPFRLGGYRADNHRFYLWFLYGALSGLMIQLCNLSGIARDYYYALSV
jgi:hypothetical protein